MDPLDDTGSQALPPVTGSILVTTLYILKTIGKFLAFLIIYSLAWLLALMRVVLLRPLLFILWIIATPFIAAGNVIHGIVSIPFRLLDKFEVCIDAVSFIN